MLFAVHNNLEAQAIFAPIGMTGEEASAMLDSTDKIIIDLPNDKLHDLKLTKVHTEEYKDHFLRPIQIGVGVLLGYIIINEIHKRQMFKQIKGWQK